MHVQCPELTVIVSEYRPVLRSWKAEAEAFKKWVTSVALPAIRKDGAYMMGDKPPHLVKSNHRTLQPRRTSLIDGGHRPGLD